jgi:GT2 family glycosyltransferase
MTCHNRRELTLGCLETLRGQAWFRECDLFLVDDGSSDGTGEAVRTVMPKANVIQGSGSLFWNGGMREAWAYAVADAQNHDFYLWLNDDVRLSPGAVAMLVADADSVVARGEAVIVAAATNEPGQDTITYGGHRRPDPRRPLRLSLVAPAGHPVPIDSISGNIVLVSAAAQRKVGNIAPDFVHIYGDIDYAFRARRMGVPVVLASRVGGTCGANSSAGSSLDEAMGTWARLKRRWAEDRKLHAQDWRRFVRLHGRGPLDVVLHRVSPYLRIIVDRPNRHAAHIAGSSDSAG